MEGDEHLLEEWCMLTRGTLVYSFQSSCSIYVMPSLLMHHF